MFSIRLIKGLTGRLALVVQVPPRVEEVAQAYLMEVLPALASDLVEVMGDDMFESSPATSELSLEKSEVSKLISDLERWLNDEGREE